MTHKKFTLLQNFFTINILILAIYLISSKVDARIIKPTNNIIISDTKYQTIAKFAISIAISDKEKETGLMNVEKLPQNQGMLFIFQDDNQRINMWMHNTLINLDMIFIDKNNKIIGLHRNAKSLDKTLIHTPINTKKVLEINAGMIDKFKIKEGYSISNL